MHPIAKNQTAIPDKKRWLFHAYFREDRQSNRTSECGESLLAAGMDFLYPKVGKASRFRWQLPLHGKNIELYLLLLNKHKNSIYAKRPNPFGEKLAASLEKFKGLALSEQCEVLNQILRLTSIGITCADLTLLGESPNSGKMLMSKNIGKSKELLLLNQSVTGIFEGRIDLLTV